MWSPFHTQTMSAAKSRPLHSDGSSITVGLSPTESFGRSRSHQFADGIDRLLHFLRLHIVVAFTVRQRPDLEAAAISTDLPNTPDESAPAEALVENIVL